VTAGNLRRVPRRRRAAQLGLFTVAGSALARMRAVAGSTRCVPRSGPDEPMDSMPADPPRSPSRYPPPEPLSQAEATKWRDWSLPGRQLSSRGNGPIGPVSWSDLVAKASGLFGESGLGFVDELKPQLEGSFIFGPMATREYGIVVGEARVRPVHKGFYGSSISSFVVAVRRSVEPPLARGTPDRPDLAHVWKTSVAAGPVVSMKRAS
jgi:hypothetical protein